jgi:hypothetical protein
MVDGNFELQIEYLTDRQREISDRLFELGVVSRIVAKGTLAGSQIPVKGFDQLDKSFVPALKRTPSGGEVGRILYLAAKAQSGEGVSAGYFELGQLDEAGILFPFPDVVAQDAETVYKEAQTLIAAKQEGTLPNLSDDLMSIDNPNTVIVRRGDL